jgi:exosortase C (VPDSG-CTERM-specific)
VEPPVAALEEGKSRSFLIKFGSIIYVVLVTAAFLPILVAWTGYAAASQLHSYVLLVPLISIYLLHLQRDQLPRRNSTSPGWAALAGVVGLTALGIGYRAKTLWTLSQNDYLGLTILSFLCLLFAGGFLFLGGKWMRAAAFPIAFLCFMIPMPDRMVEILENASQLASAEAANLLFTISGTPFLRSGTYFQLPNIVIQVAQECSGIRSSWILLLTSLIASYLFLKTPWRRAALVMFVIPLGILRNGLRVMVIGLLCVHVGPNMIHSVIHRRGGPIFFVLSLIPLFLFLWWLRSRDRPAVGTRAALSSGSLGKVRCDEMPKRDPN